MNRRAWIDEALASGVALLALAAALGLAILLARHTTVDGRAVAAAGQLGGTPGPDTVLVVDEHLGRGRRDLGRLLFPFRPAAAVASGGPPLQLDSFPFGRALLVGEVAPAALGLGAERVVGSGLVREAALGEPRLRLPALVDYGRVRVGDGADARPCRRAHHSGGVACGHEPWFYVGPVVEQLDGAGQFCLWAHPPLDGAPLQIGLQLPALVPGVGHRLQIVLGFLDEVRAETPRPPVQLTLRRGEQLAGQTACSNPQGRCVLQVDAAALAPGEALDLTLQTPDNRRQLVCLSGGLVATGEAAP